MLLMMLVILITVGMTSIKQIMRGYSIVKTSPDTLVVKVGARVVLHRNTDTDSGWVNGTLAVVTALTIALSSVK